MVGALLIVLALALALGAVQGFLGLGSLFGVPFPVLLSTVYQAIVAVGAFFLGLIIMAVA